MGNFSWAELIALGTFMFGGVAGLLTRFDKRLDKLESELALIRYRLEQLEKDSRSGDQQIENRIAKLDRAIVNLTGWASGTSCERPLQPRSTRQDGSPWPSDDPPTIGYSK